MKKILSFLMALILMAELLPAGAAADDFTLITSQEVARLEQISGYNTSAYHAGMTFSAGMTAYQMFCWLDDYLTDDAAHLSAMCSHFRLDREEHLETDADYDRVSALLARADEVIAKLEYYEFELDNLIERTETEQINLNSTEVSETDVRIASYYLKETLTEMPRLMSEFAAWQPAAVSEVNSLLTEMNGIHQDEGKTAPNLRTGSVNLSVSGAAGLKPPQSLQDLQNAQDAQARNDADYHFTVLGAEDIVIRLYDEETLLPIRDAKVTVIDELVTDETEIRKAKHKVTVPTDKYGMAIFDTGDFRLNENRQMYATILIAADGYREVLTTVFQFAAGETWEMGLKKDDGSSYLKYIIFRGVDLLHDTETVYYTPENDAVQTFRVGVVVKKGSSGTFHVHFRDATDGQEKDTVLKFDGRKAGLQELKLDNKWCQMLFPESPVVFNFESETGKGKKRVTYDSLIDVRRAIVDKPLHSFKPSLFIPGGGVNIRFPSSWGLLGRMSIGIKYPFEKLDNFPIDFSVGLDGSFILSIGLYGAKRKVNNLKGDTEADKIADGEWKRVSSKESRQALQDFKKDKGVVMREFRDGIAKKADKHKLVDFFNVTLNGSVVFMLSGSIQENKDRYVTGAPYTGILDASICLNMNANASINEPFTIPPGIPAFYGGDITFGFTLGTSLMFAADIKSTSAWDLSSWTNLRALGDTWDIAFSPYIGLTFYVGIGVKKFISVYVKFAFSLLSEIHIRPLNKVNKLRLKATFSFRFDLIVSYLIGTLNINIVDVPIWSKDSDDSGKDPGHVPIDDETGGGTDPDPAPDSSETPREDTEPVHYAAIESRKVATVDQVSPSARFVKYDDAIYYIDRDWLDDLLNRQLTSGQDYVTLNLKYFRTDTGPPQLTGFNWQGGIGHGAFPYGIPEDAYIAGFEVASSDQVNNALYQSGTGRYLNIGVLILFARTSEDEVTVTDGVEERRATRFYCELDIISSSSTIYYDNSTGSYYPADYRNIQTASIGHGFEITDPTQIHLRCEQELVRNDRVNRGENVYYAYSLLDGNELYCGVVAYQHYYRTAPLRQYCELLTKDSRHARILLDDTKKALDAYVFRADTLVNDRQGLGLDTVVLYNDTTTDEQTLTYTRYALQAVDVTRKPISMTDGDGISTLSRKPDRKLEGLLLVANEVRRPGFILGFEEPDELGKCPVCLTEVVFTGDSREYRPDSMRFTDTGVRSSPGDFHALKVGSNYVLFYPEKFTGNEQKQACHTVAGIYISRDDNNRLLLTHQMHLGEFPYTGDDPDEVSPDDILVGFTMFCDDKGFMDGAFVEMGSADSKLIHFRVKQSMQMDIRAVSTEAMTVVPGKTVNLLFKVMNTGNVPLTKFTLRAYGEDEAGNQMDISSIQISLKDNDTSSVVQKVGKAVVNQTGDAAVSQFDASDEARDLWFIRNGASYQTYETDALMPEETHNYRASFTVPIDMKHDRYTIHLAVDSLDAEAYQRQDSDLYDAAFLNPSGSPITLSASSSSGLLSAKSTGSEPVPVTVTAHLETAGGKPVADIGGSDLAEELVPVTLSVTGDETSGSGLLKAAAAPELPIAPESLPDKALIMTNDVNLSINARYAFVGEEKMVHIVIRNESVAPVDQLVVTAYVDSEETWRSSFDPDMSLDYLDTLSMDVPMSLLTAGTEGHYLDLSISGGAEDVMPVNNAERMLITNPFVIILHPEDQTAKPGDTVSFRSAASGGEKPYTWKWQTASGRRGPWTDVPGADSDVLTLKNVKLKDNGTFYRAVVTDASGRTLYSDAAMLIVTQVPKTGDAGLPAGWLVMALLSLAGAALLTARRRKQGHGA